MGPFDGGISLSRKENELNGRKSPDMLNMIYTNGILKKREGQKYLFKADGEIPDTCLKDHTGSPPYSVLYQPSKR